MQKKRDIVLLSGGADSATCLGMLMQAQSSDDVLALCLYYGQRHEREIMAARQVAEHYRVPLMEMDLSPVFRESGCSLLKGSSSALPVGSYVEQQKAAPGEPVKTYVPFRNGVLLSVASSVASSIGAERVHYGAHADDAAGNAYPDCSRDFVSAMSTAVYLGTGNQVQIFAPFVDLPKAEIIRKGLEIGVPYHLTWSCYAGGEKPCGVCGTCIDRVAAFHANGAEDPLLEGICTELQNVLK